MAVCNLDGNLPKQVACTPLYDVRDKPDRLLAQYKDSPQLVAFIKLYEDQILGNDSLLNCWNDLSIFFCIDQAVGEWLDVIGIIVGQTRTIEGGLVLPYFGFKGHPSAKSFGTIGDETKGGYWLSLGQPLSGPRDMVDEEYRIAIKARIAKNHHTGTISNTIEIFQLIFQAPCLVTDLTGDYSVFIGKRLSQMEIALIQQTDLTPEVLGFERDILYGETPFFAFQGIPCAQGFNNGNFAGAL